MGETQDFKRFRVWAALGIAVVLHTAWQQAETPR